MSWVKIDDLLTTHPKILSVGPLGLALQLRAICYCAQQLTDGMIPRPALGILTGGLDGRSPDEWARVMVDARLWEDTPGGDYQVHDYLEFNPTRKQVLAARSQRREAAKSRWSHKVTSMRDAMRPASVSHASRIRSPSPTHTPIKDPPPPPPQGEDFEAFWNAYPKDRRHGKHEASLAWRKLKPSAERVDQIMRSLEAWKGSADWLKAGGKYVPWPQKFLNRHRWEEVPDPGLRLDDFDELKPPEGM